MRHPDRQGFTLIEVLVAFAVASLLLVAILRALGLGLADTARTDATTSATILAESALDTLGIVVPLKPGTAVTQSGPFRIDATVARCHDPDGGRRQYMVLYRVTARVSWREGRHDRAVTLSTLRLGPSR